MHRQKKWCFTFSSHDAEIKTFYLRLIVGWCVGRVRSVCERVPFLSSFSVYCFLFFCSWLRSAATRSWMMSIFIRFVCLAAHFPWRMHSKCVCARVACPYERVPIQMLAQYYVKTKTEMIRTVCIVEWNDKFFFLRWIHAPHFIRKMMRTQSAARKI